MLKKNILLFLTLFLIFRFIVNGDNSLIKYEFYSYKKDFNSTLIFSIGESICYKVLKGDTLFSISKKYGVSIDTIKNLNKLKDNNIKIGQTLIIANNSLEFYSLFSHYKINLKTSHILKIYTNGFYEDQIKCFSPLKDGIIKGIRYIDGFGQTIFITYFDYLVLIGGFSTIGVKVGQNLNSDLYIGSLNSTSSISVSIFKDKNIVNLSKYIKK
jgi:LysM repeat protein